MKNIILILTLLCFSACGPSPEEIEAKKEKDALYSQYEDLWARFQVTMAQGDLLLENPDLPPAETLRIMETRKEPLYSDATKLLKLMEEKGYTVESTIHNLNLIHYFFDEMIYDTARAYEIYRRNQRQ